MKPPAEDLERRRPVWEALSGLFLDSEIDVPQCDAIAAQLASSGYSVAELEIILWGELCPTLHVNLLSPAGEWAGFDMAEVERRILSRPPGRLRRWLAYISGGRIARPAWRRIRDAMIARSVR